MKKILFIALLMPCVSILYAQSDKKMEKKSNFKIDLDFRSRFEYRHGFKKLISKDTDAGIFVRQRTRFNFLYDRIINNQKLQGFLSLQDVSTWGDSHQIVDSVPNDSFSVFQAWLQYDLTKTTSIKLGRQTLDYDDQRIFGSLDWLMHGRFHDLALIKFKKEKFHVHIGLALNNIQEPSIEILYPHKRFFSYKYMQFLHYNLKFDKGNLSFLLLNNMFQKTKTVEGQDVLDADTYSRLTTGLYFKKHINKLMVEANTYLQMGHSRTNGQNSLSAYQYMVNLSYKVGTSMFTIGYESLSGTSSTETFNKDVTDSSFFPIFGLNHKFNGFMDYFYVGNHANNVGLNDINAKIMLKALKGVFIIKGHYFLSHENIKDAKDKYLGTEIDIVYKRKIVKGVMIMGGYSQMFASENMSILKEVEKGYENINNWAWIMVKVSPTIFSYSM